MLTEQSNKHCTRGWVSVCIFRCLSGIKGSVLICRHLLLSLSVLRTVPQIGHLSYKVAPVYSAGLWNVFKILDLAFQQK